MQYFEPGAVLRSLTSSDNMVGNYTKSFLSAGKLLPANFMRGLLTLVFSSLHEGNRLLIDGFPRMYEQKKVFDEVMAERKRDFVIFYLYITDEEAINRLSTRLVCPTCNATYSTHLEGNMTYCPHDGTRLIKRTDDTSLEAVQKRIALFHEETSKLLEEYEQEGKLIKIDGTQDIHSITKEIIEHL